MRYFSSKQSVQPDEDAIAAERLMAIASRFKAELPSSTEGFEVVPDSDDAALNLFEEASRSDEPESQQ